MSLEVAFRHRFGAFELDIRFQVTRPGVTALFGPSGAGKTSIVNVIAGLVKPREGRIALNGHVVLDTQRGVFVPARKRRTGYVFQDARLFPHMTVENNLLFGWRRAPTRAGSDEIRRVVELLGLSALLKRHPKALSGGEKQRVALGRALLASPDILLLDEPLAALDQARRAEILPYLEKLRDEARLPMLYVSHTVDEVARLADELVVIRDGRVEVQGSVFDLLTTIEGAPHAAPLGAVLAARLIEQRGDGLSVLAFEGGNLLVQRIAKPLGAVLRVRIRAEDIMLACEEPRAISANNVLPARILAIGGKDASAHADVRLACGGARLVARITRASADRLALEIGRPVFAVIKSMTVDLQ